jgi:hypothetical protein
MTEVALSGKSFVDQAIDQEKHYSWMNALESYDRALELIPEEDLGSVGDILERRAYAFYRAALQAESTEQFRKWIPKAIESYDKARTVYVKTHLPDSKGRIRRCEAMTAFLNYWLTDDVAQMKRFAREAWDLAETALHDFDNANGSLEFIRTFNQLSLAAAIAYNYSSDPESREILVKEALEHAEKGICLASGSGQNVELAKAHVSIAAFTVGMERDFVDSVEKDRVDLNAWDSWLKAVELCEEAALAEVPLMVVLQGWPVACPTEERLAIYEKARELAPKTGDRFLTGCVLDGLAQRLLSMALSIEDALQRETISKQGLERAREARDSLAKVGFTSPNVSQIWVEAPEAGYYAVQSYQETDLKKKRELAGKALEPCTEQLRLAKESGYPDVEAAANVMLGFVLKDLGRSEANLERKKSYLVRSKEHLEFAAIADKKLHPLSYHIHGIDLGMLAEVEAELAGMVANPDTKKKLLRESILKKRESLSLCEKDLSSTQDTNPNLCGDIAIEFYTCGTWAARLYGMSLDKDDLLIAADAFEKAAALFSRASIPSRSAESNWDCARACDELGEFQRASERFELASKEYRKAADQVPRLRELYEDHASYMDAWGDIERARNHHTREEPGLAKGFYEKASIKHANTRRWGYLASNYSAWAQVENAEDLSRREKCKEAIKAFGEAAGLFRSSRESLQNQLARLEDPEERQMVRRLEKSADQRGDYCNARICLEEARLLDKRGEASAGSEKYGLAASMFQRIYNELESEQDKMEFGHIIGLTKAWQTMLRAEAEASPVLYAQASKLFEGAKELSLSEKGKLLAMGHSRFCRALEAGARFADTGDETLHKAATQHLESAANYYLKADLPSASAYARASKLVFDSYVYMGNAGKEADQAKKAKLYAMAEKVLEASLTHYERADQPGKGEQVLKLLAKVREDRELAHSLTEVLRAPDIVSTTMAFSTPSPSHEWATGLEKFGHADVQAMIVVAEKDLKIGDNLNVDVELVNAGRGPAQLIKIENAIPVGFEVISKPEHCRVEDDCLNLNGKRLDPLKSEGLSLVLKPTRQGQFSLKPRILYLDENGKYKSHEPEPMKVTIGTEATGLEGKAVQVDTREAAEARSLLAGLNVVTLSHYRVVGNYVRYGKAVCNALKDAKQKMVAACQRSSPKRENYIIWAPPGSGKTYFVQEVAALLGSSVHYSELNLAKLDEGGFRSGLANLRDAQGPCLCLVDEVDANTGVSWPYEALMPFLDASATEAAQFVFVLAGSSGSSLEEMKQTIASRPKGPDILSRVPTDNEYSIPPMGVGDRLLVVLSQFRQAGKQMGHEVREVEKLGLYYVALNPRLSNARQLREFAVRCAERVLPGDDRLKYDSLFRPGDLENKLFWTQALQSAGALVDSFLLIED